MDNFEKAISDLSLKKENYSAKFQTTQTEYNELEEKQKFRKQQKTSSRSTYKVFK